MHATPYHVPIAVYTFSRITRKQKPKSYASSQWPLKAQGVKIKCNTNVILTEEFVVWILFYLFFSLTGRKLKIVQHVLMRVESAHSCAA